MLLLSQMQMQMHLAAPAQLQKLKQKQKEKDLWHLCRARLSQDCRKAMPDELSQMSFELQRIRIRIQCVPRSRCRDKDEWHTKTSEWVNRLHDCMPE